MRAVRDQYQRQWVRRIILDAPVSTRRSIVRGKTDRVVSEDVGRALFGPDTSQLPLSPKRHTRVCGVVAYSRGLMMGNPQNL